MSFLWGGFDKGKLKSHLSMTIDRIRIRENKRKNKLKIDRKEIVGLLKDKKWDKARIRVEGVIRETKEGEAMEILEIMCDVLLQRMGLIASEKTCPEDMIESVHTVIWASPRSQIDELKEVKTQLIAKYGEAFCAPAVRGDGPDKGGRVNDKIRSRLTLGAPPEGLKLEYLMAIAAEGGLKVEPSELSESAVGMVTGPPAPLDPALAAAARADAAAGGAGHGGAGGAGDGGGGGGGGAPLLLPGIALPAPGTPMSAETAAAIHAAAMAAAAAAAAGHPIPSGVHMAPGPGGVSMPVAAPSAGMVYWDPATNTHVQLPPGYPAPGHAPGGPGGPGGMGMAMGMPIGAPGGPMVVPTATAALAAPGMATIPLPGVPGMSIALPMPGAGGPGAGGGGGAGGAHGGSLPPGYGMSGGAGSAVAPGYSYGPSHAGAGAGAAAAGSGRASPAASGGAGAGSAGRYELSSQQAAAASTAALAAMLAAASPSGSGLSGMGGMGGLSLPMPPGGSAPAAAPAHGPSSTASSSSPAPSASAPSSAPASEVDELSNQKAVSAAAFAAQRAAAAVAAAGISLPSPPTGGAGGSECGEDPAMPHKAVSGKGGSGVGGRTSPAAGSGSSPATSAAAAALHAAPSMHREAFAAAVPTSNEAAAAAEAGAGGAAAAPGPDGGLPSLDVLRARFDRLRS